MEIAGEKIFRKCKMTLFSFLSATICGPQGTSCNQSQVLSTKTWRVAIVGFKMRLIFPYF